MQDARERDIGAKQNCFHIYIPEDEFSVLTFLSFSHISKVSQKLRNTDKEICGCQVMTHYWISCDTKKSIVTVVSQLAPENSKVSMLFFLAMRVNHFYSFHFILEDFNVV